MSVEPYLGFQRHSHHGGSWNEIVLENHLGESGDDHGSAVVLFSHNGKFLECRM